jgi:hypothetical protein
MSPARDFVSVKDFGAVGDGVTDDWAAFKAAHDSFSAPGSAKGGRLLVPAGNYYLSDTLAVSKRITFEGDNAADQSETAATRLTFAPNKTGIRFYSKIDSPEGSGADYSRLVNINIAAVSKQSTGIGIHATCVIKMEYGVVRNFAGGGIFINGQTGEGATGIADGWAISHTRIADCGGNGLHTKGNDSQVGTATQVEVTHCDGWGYYDESPYGNLYLACQSSGNALGSYYGRTVSTYYGSVYVSCYVEFGPTQITDFDADAIVIGGTLAAVSGNASGYARRFPGGFGPNVPAGGIHAWFRDGAEIARIGTDSVISGLSGARFGTTTNYTDMTGPLVAQVTSVNSGQDRFRFDTPSGRAGSIQTAGLTTTYSTTSDYRLKEGAEPITGALADICALNPVTFRWKHDGSAGRGFIAHELQAVAPDCVTGEKDGEDYQSIDPAKLVPTLVAAVQELTRMLGAKP